MRILFACMLALAMGSAVPAFAAADTTTAGASVPAAHAAPKHKRAHAAKHVKHVKKVHHSVKKDTK